MTICLLALALALRCWQPTNHSLSFHSICLKSDLSLVPAVYFRLSHRDPGIDYALTSPSLPRLLAPVLHSYKLATGSLAIMSLALRTFKTPAARAGVSAFSPLSCNRASLTLTVTKLASTATRALHTRTRPTPHHRFNVQVRTMSNWPTSISKENPVSHRVVAVCDGLAWHELNCP